MAAGGVVALKLVVDLCRGAELFLEAVGSDQRRGAVHLVKIADFRRDFDIRRVVVQLLTDQLVAENGAQIVKRHGLACTGVQQRRGLVFHVGTEIVPCRGHLIFGEIDFVRNLFRHVCVHLSLDLQWMSQICGTKRKPSCPYSTNCWDRRGKLLRCHPA